MRSKTSLLILVACLLFLSVGCEVEKPTCTGDSLVAPVQVLPVDASVADSLTPTLTWSYPDTSCDPEGYDLHIAMGPLYLTELGTTLYGPQDYYGPISALLPGKAYEWWVTARSGAFSGPASDRHFFFTGPACTAAQMSAPVLIGPGDGAKFNVITDKVQWDSTGGCIPEGYRQQYATDAAFTDVVLSQDFPKPWNGGFWGNSQNPFSDCVRYYWHVAQLVGGSAGPYSETWSFQYDPTGTCAPIPTCAGSSLMAPVNLGPASLIIVSSLTPAITWSYPDASCNPQGYDLHFAMGPLYVPELAGTQDLAGTSWTPTAPLLPGKVYEWWLSAQTSTVNGPDSGRSLFFTGPVCASSEMTAPVLYEPIDGAVFNPITDMTKWDSTGGCLPDAYRLQFATDPAFGDVILSQDYPLPLNRGVWGNTLTPFTDCSIYYWHVAQLVGGNAGSYSETWSFRVNSSGTCP